MEILVPMDVPEEMRDEYANNYKELTHDTGKLMLYAGDQKVEHLNSDFVGKNIHADDADPEHLFKIANKAKIGCFAAQLGLIARYGGSYKDVPYLVKMNSKTNLVGKDIADPVSQAWYDVEQVLTLKENGLNILGLGYTLYLGSEMESDMLTEAAQIINHAHQYGLVVVLWVYPRGEAVKDETSPHLIAGATGVAACLGADFVKVNYPKQEGVDGAARAELFKEAVTAAGRTGVVCAGGSSTDARKFLQALHDQIHISGAAGNATGRNIHQKGFDEAVRMTDAIYAITVEEKSVDEALKIYEG